MAVSPLICENCNVPTGRYVRYQMDSAPERARKMLGHVFVICRPDGSILGNDCLAQLIRKLKERLGSEVHVSRIEDDSWLSPGAHNPDNWG